MSSSSQKHCEAIQSFSKNDGMILRLGWLLASIVSSSWLKWWTLSYVISLATVEGMPLHSCAFSLLQIFWQVEGLSVRICPPFCLWWIWSPTIPTVRMRHYGLAQHSTAKTFPYKTEALQVEFQSNSHFCGSARRGTAYKMGLSDACYSTSFKYISI